MGDGDLPSGVGGPNHPRGSGGTRGPITARQLAATPRPRMAAAAVGTTGVWCGPRALEKAVLQVPGTIPGQMRSTPAGRRCTNAYTAGPPADHGRRPTHYACSACP